MQEGVCTLGVGNGREGGLYTHSMGRCWRPWSLSGGVQGGVEQEVHDQEVKGGVVEHEVHGM